MVSLSEAKETGSHYTSNDLSHFMADRLKQAFLKYNFNEIENLTLIDPSCGDGELLKAAATLFEDNSVKLLGVDTDANAIQSASNYFGEDSSVSVFQSDYLELFDNYKTDLFSLNGDKSNDLISEGTLNLVDLILANPPYVRTQVMGADRAQKLGEMFGLKGRVDLYQAFLVAMTQHLKVNGLICVITSNRYLTTAGGKDIRAYLDKNYEILEVIDLGDTKLFNAAVLPAIFIGRKKAENENIKNENVKCYRIYEDTSDGEVDEVCTSIYEILYKNESGIYAVGNKKYSVMSGYLKVPEDSKELWVMASKEDKEWVNQIKNNSFCKFSDMFKVRVGIKTTADNVFIHNNNEWEALAENIKPEAELLNPLISSDNIQKWKSDGQLVEQKKILYTHQFVEGKRKAIDLDDYVNAKAYLLHHHEQLAGRTYLAKSKTRHWYEIWVPQEPMAFKDLKIVFPDISLEPKFSIDTNEYLVDGNCYWITLKEQDADRDLLYLAAAIANSQLMNRFHGIEFQNVLYSGRKRYLTQYVDNYVLPDPSSIYSRKIVEVTKNIVTQNLEIEEIKQLELEIEKQVRLAFSV